MRSLSDPIIKLLIKRILLTRSKAAFDFVPMSSPEPVRSIRPSKQAKGEIRLLQWCRGPRLDLRRVISGPC